MNDTENSIRVEKYIKRHKSLQVNGVTVYICEALVTQDIGNMTTIIPYGLAEKVGDTAFILINSLAELLEQPLLEALVAHEQGHIELGHFNRERGMAIECEADDYAKSEGKPIKRLLELVEKELLEKLNLTLPGLTERIERL